MKPPRIVRFDDVAPQRWRNGGGWARELLVLPAGDAWRVRVSVADIEQDGPFSAFPGVERHFAVLDGAGVTLTIGGTPLRVVRETSAVSFAGDAAVTCSLIDGPTRDLNLMVRGGDGSLHAVRPGEAWRCAAPGCGLFATAPGFCRCAGATVRMPAMALAWFDDAPAALVFDATGWWLAA